MANTSLSSSPSSPRRAHRRDGAWTKEPTRASLVVPTKERTVLPPDSNCAENIIFRTFLFSLCAAAPPPLAAGRSGGWAGALLATCAVLLGYCAEAQPQLRQVRELFPSLPFLLPLFFRYRKPRPQNWFVFPDIFLLGQKGKKWGTGSYRSSCDARSVSLSFVSHHTRYVRSHLQTIRAATPSATSRDAPTTTTAPAVVDSVTPTVGRCRLFTVSY
jgi:hypothetical protein